MSRPRKIIPVKLPPIYSVVIPVYKNAESIPQLFSSLESSLAKLCSFTEVIFINDGSPDDSNGIILSRARTSPLQIRIVQHSRNFGSFSAIRTGLEYARGDYVGVISADLQEPTNLLINFFSELTNGNVDIVFGTRSVRNDPFISKLFSSTYWKAYRKFINKEIPESGVDVFACTRNVVNILKTLKESNSSLIGMLFWVGFRRTFIKYDRLQRKEGKSSWSFQKKLRYMSDSVFAFSDLPIRAIRFVGFVGVSFTSLFGTYLIYGAVDNKISVPGYVPIMLAILFGNSALLIALGILGSYIWRAYANSQMRPFSITSAEIGITNNDLF
jgi:glycosyltransferase involved in cell wall biosynthesis